jgi:coenzyme PQQ precursor peptide PqqA
MEMPMRNPGLVPLSFRFGVVTLDICPNTGEALDKPAGLASASLSATRIHTITSSIGGLVITLAPPVPVSQPRRNQGKQYRVSVVFERTKTMEWTAPKFEEVALNCEINSYASAAL